jgi:DNA-binding response OmpR family regulator
MGCQFKIPMATVLVVDDDPKFLNAVEQMLVVAGYHVLRAIDGNQAVDLLEKKHSEIDLIILDLALPGINGFEIIGAVSRRPSSVKIIATTSVYKECHFEMAGTLGAHAAIRKPPEGKPLPEREWLAAVRRHLGARARDLPANAARVQVAEDLSESQNGTEASH